MALLNSSIPQQSTAAPCKCCRTPSPLLGEVDFNKNCNAQSNLPASGVRIPYHRCPQCGLIFTVVFDRFSHADFREHIYNDDYLKVDPDYTGVRPTANARIISQLFGKSPDLKILDYGGGNGLLAQHLAGYGFHNVRTYDIFVPPHATRPQEKFDLIVAFEVLEHTTDPAAIFADIDSLLKPSSMIVFTTLLQPPQIDALGVQWWYVGPRNGHVSLFTPAALRAVLNPMGISFGSLDMNLHVAWRVLPEFARHFIKL